MLNSSTAKVHKTLKTGKTFHAHGWAESIAPRVIGRLNAILSKIFMTFFIEIFLNPKTYKNAPK